MFVVGRVPEVVAVFQLWVTSHHDRVLHNMGGYSDGLQTCVDLGSPSNRCPRLDRGFDLRSKDPPTSDVGFAPLGGKTQEVAQAAPLFIVFTRDRYPLIVSRTGVDTVGQHRWVSVPYLRG
tara:strand:- start:61 stop:423 length:363 start_codon:yes stop_codon:yes gene_type:complete